MVAKTRLSGLAAHWETTDSIRRRLVWDDALLVWPSDESVGCASYVAAKANFDVLKPLFLRWVDTSKKPRAMSKIPIQVEAMVS